MLTLDHVSHFVPDIDAASTSIERLGFTLTPFSAQSHRLQPDGPLTPAGTGNRCVMLESGYLEFLTPTADTPVAAQLRAAIARYVGVHLIAFGTDAAGQDHARLAAAGFDPVPPVALQRPIATESGEGTARFTVVRVPPGGMAEGRIQYCQHHTPELLWQRRWIDHANGALALAGVLLCVADPAEAARRYERFTGLPHERENDAWLIRTARGTLVFAGAERVAGALGIAPPALPWIAGYAVRVRDLPNARKGLQCTGFGTKALGAHACEVTLPDALGGVIVFHDTSDFRLESTA